MSRSTRCGSRSSAMVVTWGRCGHWSAGDRVRAICVTHCHSDHSPLAAWLKEETGAATFAFGPHPPSDPDDPAVAEELEEEITEGVKVEEAIDLAFAPDV